MNTMSTNTTSDLTTVIPAKNEASLIRNLLASLVRQDYSKILSTKVLVADANSTDGTPEIALAFRKWLDINVIPGGLPAVGRNNGAAVATTAYLLFLDADIELASDSLLRDAIELAQRKQLECVTTKIVCRHGNALDKILYSTNNLFQHLSRLHRPFSTGMFMLFERRKFQELGGFHEQAQFAEDYLLSKQVERAKFGIVRGGVYTTNRRFKKMGHFRVARLLLKTALNHRNEVTFFAITNTGRCNY